jgi:hypothetical protein
LRAFAPLATHDGAMVQGALRGRTAVLHGFAKR